MIAVKGAQRADGLVERRAGKPPLRLKVAEEAEHLAGVEIRKCGSGVMVGELVSPAEVGFYGALAQPFELDEGGVMLVPIGGGDVPAR